MAKSRRRKPSLRERARTARLIFSQSMRLMARERRLWVFPAATAAVGLVTILVLVGATFLLAPVFAASDGAGAWWGLAFVLFLYPLMLAGAFTNTALAYAASEALQGRRVSPRVAWSRAWSLRGPVVRYSLVILGVAGVFQVVGVLLEKARIVPGLGRIVNAVGALGWAAASFFVVPILALERDPTVFAAVKRSASVARAQWGKSVAGLVTIQAAVMLPILAATLGGALLVVGVFAVGFAIGGTVSLVVSFAVGGLLVLGILGVALGLGMLGQAALTIYQTALYRFATTGAVNGPFTKATLHDAWAPYRSA